METATQMSLFEEYREEFKAKRNKYISKHIDKKNKFKMNLVRKKPKYMVKNTNSFELIDSLINKLDDCTQLHLISSAFDSPAIIYAVNRRETVRKIYVSTWAITDRGLSALADLNDTVESYLLLDKTYSYKWVFESGAIDLLKRTKLKFTENHSKMILIETEKNKYTFIGSMNLTNNPRIENIMITKDTELFEFYKDFILNEFE